MDKVKGLRSTDGQFSYRIVAGGNVKRHMENTVNNRAIIICSAGGGTRLRAVGGGVGERGEAWVEGITS